MLVTNAGALPTNPDIGPAPGSSVISSAPARIVGIYVGSPGAINFRVSGGCGWLGCGWPPHLPTNPTLGRYDTGTRSYVNYELNLIASMGIDFIIFDESNGMHYGAPPLQQDLLNTLTWADQRMVAGIPTPHITVVSPMPGTPNGVANDNDWVLNNLVMSNGQLRPSWLWLNGKPVWIIFTFQSFQATYQDSRFFIRYTCDSANNQCHSAEKSLGTVWPWGTQGEPGPLYSPNSEEITIQNGYSNQVAWLDYRHDPPPPPPVVGFTGAYYQNQWATAIADNPQIIVISDYGPGIEGGEIEPRVDFSPPTLYQNITTQEVQFWKGTLSLWNLGPSATINVAPSASLYVTVDGVKYASSQLPKTFSWFIGSTHNLTLDSNIQGSSGVRYVFVQWSDGSTQNSRSLVVTQDTKLTATYKTQYQLTVVSDIGNPLGTGWYDAGTQASFSVSSPQPGTGLMGTLGGKSIFQGWSGDSNAASPSATISMDGAKTVTATWASDNTQPYAVLGGIAAVLVIVVASVILMRRKKNSTQPQHSPISLSASMI
jgi:uncharacterized repeat protein (TIGR02543 family)